MIGISPLSQETIDLINKYDSWLEFISQAKYKIKASNLAEDTTKKA